MTDTRNPTTTAAKKAKNALADSVGNTLELILADTFGAGARDAAQ